MEHIAKSETGIVRGPRWIEWLGHLKDTPCKGMELGTFQGSSAEWFLDNICTHKDSFLYCVDTFKGSDEHHLHGIDVSRNYEIAEERLARFTNKAFIENMSHKQMLSVTSVGSGTFDFLYVDADHSARGCLRDAVIGFELLKVGGIMIFDDYQWTALPKEIDRPKMAVDAFINCYAKEMELLPGRGYQVALKKIKE
jgi:predicted O-methyltransferase YrrM